MYTTSVIDSKLPSIGQPKWDTENDFLGRLKPYLLGKIPYILYLGTKEKSKRDIITVFQGRSSALSGKPDTINSDNASQRSTYKQPKSQKLPMIFNRKQTLIKTPNRVAKTEKIQFDKNEYDWINISHARIIKPKEENIYRLENALHIMTDPSINEKQKKSNQTEKLQNTYEFITRKPSDPPNDHVDPYKSYYAHPKTINPYDKSQNGVGWRTVLKNNSLWEDRFRIDKIHQSGKQKQKEKLLKEYYNSFDRVKCNQLTDIHHDYKLLSRLSDSREKLVLQTKRGEKTKEDELDLLIQLAEVNGQGDKDMALMAKSLDENDKSKSRRTFLQNINREKIFWQRQTDIFVSTLNQ